MSDKGVIFKGSIKIEIDSALVQGSLILAKEGEELWDDPKLLHKISEAGGGESFDKDALVKLVNNFHKSKETRLVHVFAKGELPEPAKAEELAWSVPEIPADLQALAQKILRNAPPPELYNIRVDKVTVEKRQPAKAGLFGAGKEEIVKVVENREVKERVSVDPAVERTGYVDAGIMVATIVPPTTGKPGKDLLGKTIPPSQAVKKDFFLGNGLVRGKGEVTTSISGFLRLGKNWAEIVPYAAHKWEVTFSEDRTNCFFNLTPGNPESPKVQAKDVLDFLAKEGFPADRLLDANSITRMIDGALYRREAIVGQPLTPNEDGSFEIVITPDQVKATLSIKKPSGQGKPVSLKDLGQALKELKFKGYDFEAAKNKVTEFMKSPEGQLKDYILAQGKVPTRGKDKIVEFSVPFLDPAVLKAINERAVANNLTAGIPKLDVLPLDKVEKAAEVQAGQQLARLKEPDDGKGETGLDVFGEKIPPYPGNDPVLHLLSGVRLRQDTLEADGPGLLDVAVTPEGVFFRLRQHQNSLIEVKRSVDAMEATLTLHPGKGTGEPLSMEKIEEALKNEQVLEGIDRVTLKEAFDKAQRGARIENLLIARGKPPANDIAKRLKWLAPLKISPDGKAASGPVKEGQLIAEYAMPDPNSADGVDITGNVIPSNDTGVADLAHDEKIKSTVKPNEMVRQYFAAANGEFQFDGRSLSISNQKVWAQGVNARTGSVKFAGSVLVEGGVERGFYVMAGGDLKVKGMVGACLLSSDSNLQVLEGVRGEGKAVLRAKKHIGLGFVEKATIMAVGDLYIQKTAMQCTIRCNSRVIQKLPGGGLVGGMTKTKHGIEVMNLGSPNGVPTHISFGQDYLIEDQIQAEMKETDNLRGMILKIDDMMKRLGGPNDKDKLAAIRHKKVLAIKMLEKRNLRLIHLRDKFEAHFPSEIIVKENLFPGVTIESHGRLYEVKARKAKLKLVFNLQTGHIEEIPL